MHISRLSASKREVQGTLDGDLLRCDCSEEKNIIIASQDFSALLSETRMHIHGRLRRIQWRFEMHLAC
jgi:hypothetical protein